MVEVIWTGPANLDQVKQPGPGVHVVTCLGDGSPTCGQMADANGRNLDTLGAQLGISAGTPLVLRAFSAGGSAWKRYLEPEASRARVLAVTLSDATYEETAGFVAPGFLAYALECLSGSKLLVATASSAPNTYGGGNKPNGAQVLDALRSAIEQQSGHAFEPLALLPGVDQAPDHAWHLGGIYFADFGSTFKHEEHATVLGPLVWSGIVEPWLNGTAAAVQGAAAAPVDVDDVADTDNVATSPQRHPIGRALLGAAAVGGALFALYQLATAPAVRRAPAPPAPPAPRSDPWATATTTTRPTRARSRSPAR